MFRYTANEIGTVIYNLNQAIYDLQGGTDNPHSIDIDKAIDILNNILEEGLAK